MNNWTYQGQVITELPPDCIGFVYVITNRTTQKKYVGKKLAQFTKTTYKTHTQKNGVKKKKRVVKQTPSDWPTYWGSSNELSKDIELMGQHNFRREIIHYCHSKGQLSYLEAREQFDRRVLESDQYYNNAIQVRVHHKHLTPKKP